MQTCAKWKATEQHNKESRKAGKQQRGMESLESRQEQHDEACALLGSAGLEATEPVRKQHSRGFVLPGWPAVELLKYKVRPEYNHPSQSVEGNCYRRLNEQDGLLSL